MEIYSTHTLLGHVLMGKHSSVD